MKTDANPIYARWLALENKPLGKWLFSVLLGRMAPYTGSISPRVVELGPGHAVVRMADRGRLRNHLRSIHAIALMNLGEVTSGLAVISGIPADARGIVTRLSMEYLKKGRGTLVGICDCEFPSTTEEREYEVIAEIRDQEADLVARATATWLIGPK